MLIPCLPIDIGSPNSKLAFLCKTLTLSLSQKCCKCNEDKIPWC